MARSKWVERDMEDAVDCILLRVHQDDEYVRKAVAALSSLTKIPVYLLADETRGALSSLGMPKISITNREIEHLKVPGCQNPLYTCGDYGLYVARQQLPFARFYWLIEADVVINFTSSQDFFSLFDAVPDDFLTSFYGPTQKEWWSWHDTMKPFAEKVYKCFFPVNRFSGRAIDHLHSGRKIIRERYIKMQKEEGYSGWWPNDEAFVATWLTNERLACSDINAHGSTVYKAESFRFGLPNSAKYVARRKPDNLIYHPVLSGEHYLKRVMYMATEAVNAGNKANLVQTLEKMNAWEQIEVECGVEALSSLRAVLI